MPCVCWSSFPPRCRVSHWLLNVKKTEELDFFDDGEHRVVWDTRSLSTLVDTDAIYLNMAKGYKNLGTNENSRYWLVKHHPGGLICRYVFFSSVRQEHSYKKK